MRLPKRQEQTLFYIHHYTEVNGYAPSMAEMAGEFGCYPNAVYELIGRMINRGLVTKSKKVARSLRVTEKGKQYVKENI